MTKDWEVKKLGDVCKISTGKSNANESVIDGKYAFFDRSKTVKRSDHFLFDCEALIIPGEGAQFFPRFYSGKFNLHQRAYALFEFEKDVDIRFVEYQLISGHKYFEEVAVGATVKSLRLRHFQDFKLFLPSLSEQKRIVKILDKKIEFIENLTSVSDEQIRAVQELFENRLNELLFQKNDDWIDTVLGELCESVQYGSSSKSKQKGKVPVLRMGNIQDGQIDWKKLVYTDNEQEIKKYLLRKDDVLFNRTNSPELVGKTAIYKGEKPAIFAGYLIRINRKESELDAGFLNYYLNSSFARKYGVSIMNRSTNQANINGAKLKKYPISVPSLKEQKRIAQELDILKDHLKDFEEIIHKKITELEELKRSYLHEAFSGKL